MNKKLKVALFAIVSIVVICILGFGIFFGMPFTGSINEQVFYSVNDAKVLVQGKVNGARGQSAVDYPSAIVSANDVTATRVTNKSNQYLDYTTGSKNSLSTWSIGKLKFAQAEEIKFDTRDIEISFKLTNLSTHPVKATLSFPDNTKYYLEDAKLNQTAIVRSVYLAANGGSKEMTVVYGRKSNKGSAGSFEGNINIKLEKSESGYMISEMERAFGSVIMGKKSANSTEEDVEWKCFAYSTDGTTWTTCTGEIPTTAKYGYFVLDTYVESLAGKAFLSSDKYTQNSSDNNRYINAGENGVAAANTVFANDYYYSDIRQTLKNVDTMLDISSNNEIFNAIQYRSMYDLYGDIDVFGNRLYLPTNAMGNVVDRFWLLSNNEVNTYFADDGARKWTNGNLFVNYWLRTPHTNESHRVWLITENRGGGVIVDNANGVRPAFQLKLV